MSISINPVLPVISVQGATSDIALQAGTVIDAQVLKILSENLVRIAIANVALDVISEVPLQAGQTLQLAVSQNADGIRLAMVSPDGTGQGGQSAGAPTGVSGGANPISSSGMASSAGPSADAAASVAASLGSAPETFVTVAGKALANVTAPVDPLTPPERAAVSVVAQGAAARQDSLAPLFANLAVAAGAGNLPAKLQQAVMQVLAQRPALDQNLTGDVVKSAFQNSGLFLEASLAAGSISNGAAMPDLKAALIVLRQALLSSMPAADAIATSTSAAMQVLPPSARPGVTSAAATPPGDTAASPRAIVTSSPAPPLAPEFDGQEILLPQSPAPVPGLVIEQGLIGGKNIPAAVLEAMPRAATAGAMLNLLQESGLLQDVAREAPGETGAAAQPLTSMSKTVRGDDVTFHSNTPPPPFRGALPTAQSIAAPSIDSHAPLAVTAHHLLDDTDAAIARQTLLQVASLPDRADGVANRLDPTAPRWNFEIPFATPLGTAMAQFEISRDGGGSEVEATKRAWRARFSLDVEPAGPVHALVSLNGERTSVRMWAERPATAAQLRAGAAQLGEALAKAQLQPGDIVIRDGAPPQSRPAPAGHFLDRAS